MLRLGSRVWHSVTEQRDVYGGEIHHFNGLQPTGSWDLRTKHRQLHPSLSNNVLCYFGHPPR